MSTVTRFLTSTFSLAFLATSLCFAAEPTKVGKFFVSTVKGKAVFSAGNSIEPLEEKATFPAQGVIFESMSDGTCILVFSNNTGVHVASSTRFEVKRFVQAPFAANRNDIEMEPSVSTTAVSVEKGSVAVCSSKLVAGSIMNYQTPHASIALRVRRVLIEVSETSTLISLLEGEATIRRGGDTDAGGQILKPGQQMIITVSAPGATPVSEVRDIPSEALEQIGNRIAEACMARSTVFFDTGEPTGEVTATPTSPTNPVPTTVSNAVQQ